MHVSYFVTKKKSKKKKKKKKGKNAVNNNVKYHPAVTAINKELLDEVFEISRIINVEVGVISRS